MSPKILKIIVSFLIVVLAGFSLYNIFNIAEQVFLANNPPEEKSVGPEPEPSDETASTTATSTAETKDQAGAVSSKPAATPSAPKLGSVEVMAWIYPGNPTCSASREYADGRKIDILKPEYFKISEEGDLTLITEEEGCNGYSAKNVADIKKHSKEQYATISSSYSGSMDLFLTKALQDSSYVDRLTSFVVDNKITGIELDFEDFGGWSQDSYLKYKKFVTNLGNSLHKNNKKLMIDGPATSSQTEESWYVWRYADFVSLPVDRIVIMAYDYQYDQGVGEPVSPVSWVKDTVKWTLTRFPDKKRLSVGIPSYGYKGTVGTHKFSLLTYEQIKKEPGFGNAVRDADSSEMTWKNGDTIYFYQTSDSMAKKLQAVRDLGITSVSVWHLGGNMWFK